MTSKPQTILKQIQELENPSHSKSFLDFYEWLIDEEDSSIRNATNYLTVLRLFSVDNASENLDDITKEDVLKFLDKRRKSSDDDPDKKWMRTWNDYFSRLIGFYKWLTNRDSNTDREDWHTPEPIKSIKKKKSKRKTSYSPNDVWTEDELLLAVKYSGDIRTKLVLTLAWDMAARNQEIIKIKIKDIVMKEKYAEISTAWDTKTGIRTNPSIVSFPYLREYLNHHPFSREPDSFLILSKTTMKPITTDTIWKITKELKIKVTKMLDAKEIEKEDIEKLSVLLQKPWNPYLVGRHSSITEKTDTLTDSQLKQFSGWTPNSDRITTYVHRNRKQVITPLLEEYGIVEKKERSPVRRECPKCGNINTHESVMCSNCSFVLNNKGWEHTKLEEIEKEKSLKLQLSALELKILEQQQKLDDTENFKEEMRQEFKDMIKGLKPKSIE